MFLGKGVNGPHTYNYSAEYQLQTSLVICLKPSSNFPCYS